MLWIQLESVAAVTSAFNLAKPGVDCLSFGPADLQMDIDHGGHPALQTVDDCVAHAVEELEGTETAVCFRSGDPEHRQRYLDMGVRVILENAKICSGSDLGVDLEHIALGVGEVDGAVTAGLVGGRLEDFDALGDELLVAGNDLVGRDEEGELDTGELASGALAVVAAGATAQRELDCPGLEGESGGGFGGDRVVELAHGAEHGRSPIGVDG